MKIFDTSKIQRGRIFHIQDRDEGFVFIGRVRFYGLDFIQFDDLPDNEPPSCKTRGMYTFDIGSKFILHGVKWNDKRKEYVYDESIIASEYLEKDDESIITNENIDKDKGGKEMKFDVKKVHELLYDSKFHIQDHDNKFQFYGILKLIEPDKLTFYITGPFYGSECRGTYSFPAGSKFTLHKLRLDEDKKEWIYTPGIIGWKDITETDDDNVEEENNMTEEKNTTGLLPCVVSLDDAWSIDERINNGDHIYRIFNDKFDIKANMRINYLGGYGMPIIGLHLIDTNADISNIEIDKSMRVCLTSSENDPGTLVMKQNMNFNKALRSGCLYRIIDSSLNFQYLMYIRCFHEGHIDADVMKPVINEEYIDADIMKLVSNEEECSKIKTEHEQLSLIDLKDIMFNQIYFTEGCHLNLE